MQCPLHIMLTSYSAVVSHFYRTLTPAKFKEFSKEVLSPRFAQTKTMFCFYLKLKYAHYTTLVLPVNAANDILILNI